MIKAMMKYLLIMFTVNYLDFAKYNDKVVFDE